MATGRLVGEYVGHTGPKTTAAQAGGHQYEVTPDARGALADLFERMPRGEGFGNGRSARQVFQAMTERQAYRLSELVAATPEQLVSLVAADLPVLGSS